MYRIFPRPFTLGEICHPPYGGTSAGGQSVGGLMRGDIDLTLIDYIILYQNSVYLKYNVFFDGVYCNHTEKVYFMYTISILGVYFNPSGQIARSIL